MGFKSFVKKSGKYIVKKISKSAVGRAFKYAFWGTLCFYGPTSVIGIVGIQGLIAGAAITHSGLVEYSAGKMIDTVL